jgi:hypothetical protein
MSYRVKPSHPTFRRDHPIATGLRGFYVDNSQRQLYDVVTGTNFEVQGVEPGLVNTPYGGGLDLSDKTVSTSTRFDTDLACTPQWTIAISVAFTALNNFDRITVFNGQTTDSTGITLNGSNAIRVVLQNGGFRQANSTLVPTLGRWYFLVATYNQATLKLYSDGSEIATTNQTAAAVSLTPFRIATSNPTDGGNPGAQFHCAMAAVWNRGIDASEVAQLSADPFEIVRPRQRSYFYAALAEPPTPTFKPYFARRQTQGIGVS